MTPLVSILIPCHNAAPWLGATLESALAQTWPHREIIVVDDGSTDATRSIVQQLEPAVRLISQDNAGAAVARNRGLEVARGEYVAFLDADDCWHPRKAELQLKHLQSCAECAAVYCRKIEFRDDEAMPVWQAVADDAAPATARGHGSGWLYLDLLRSSLVHTSTIMLSRATLDRVGRFDTDLRKGQDLDFWLRLSRLAPIHMLDAVLSAYRIHGSSISHRAMDTNFHAHVVERAVGRFGPYDPAGNRLGPDELRRILGASWFEFAYQHYRAGTLARCLEGLRRSLGYQPYRWQAWVLALRAKMGTLRPGVGKIGPTTI